MKKINRFSLRQLLIFVALLSILLAFVSNIHFATSASCVGCWITVRGQSVHGIQQLVLLYEPYGVYIGVNIVNDNDGHTNGILIGRWRQATNIWEWEKDQR